MKICRENPNFVKTEQKCRAFYMDPKIPFIVACDKFATGNISRICLFDILYCSTIRTERIVVTVMHQWLRECAIIWCSTYTAYLVL